MYMLFYKLVHMSSACFLWPCWPGIWGWAVGNIWCVCCIVMEFFSMGKQNWFSSIYFFKPKLNLYIFNCVNRPQSSEWVGLVVQFLCNWAIIFHSLRLSAYKRLQPPAIDWPYLPASWDQTFFFFFMLKWAGTTLHQFIQKSKWCALLSANPAA